MVEINGETVKTWSTWKNYYALYTKLNIGIPVKTLNKFKEEGNNIFSPEKEVINYAKRDGGEYIKKREYLCLTDGYDINLVMFGFLENKTSEWLNAYLSENPVHIYYELKTPIYTQI